MVRRWEDENVRWKDGKNVELGEPFLPSYLLIFPRSTRSTAQEDFGGNREVV
jgi:hypothetical protein